MERGMFYQRFIVTGLTFSCLCAAGYAQQAPPHRPTGPASDAKADQAPIDVQRGNGSLLRATLASQPDPAQARLSAVSFFTVPEPQPKTIKKHDLVTIIVREQTDMKTE